MAIDLHKKYLNYVKYTPHHTPINDGSNKSHFFSWTITLFWFLQDKHRPTIFFADIDFVVVVLVIIIVLLLLLPLRMTMVLFFFALVVCFFLHSFTIRVFLFTLRPHHKSHEVAECTCVYTIYVRANFKQKFLKIQSEVKIMCKKGRNIFFFKYIMMYIYLVDMLSIYGADNWVFVVGKFVPCCW